MDRDNYSKVLEVLLTFLPYINKYVTNDIHVKYSIDPFIKT